MLQPLYNTLALQICPERITFSVYATFSILMHTLNSSYGPFPSMKAQIHSEEVQFIGQGTQHSSSSSSSSRISSKSTVIPKIIKNSNSSSFLKLQVLHISQVLQEYGILRAKLSDITSALYWKFL